MSIQSIGLPPSVASYIQAVSLRESDRLQHLRQAAAEHPLGHMQIAPEQGQFIGLLLQLMGAKRVLEIGVFMGYSALAIAQSLPPEGRLIACEINTEYAAIAQQHWQKAGVANQIDLRLAPALETLDDLLATGQAETFDFVLIDADKRNYGEYFERSLQLVRSGGVIAIDNVLWSGRVADPSTQDNRTKRMRQFNETLHHDPRVQLTLVPIGDGLTLARKTTL
ncbi:MAG: class I SAM-dependent methyltransferase [Oculatellaceae cyanobacterium Prado106]|nr:class I SAM-dependent methyltransferase [Oculatellaceae cyanobacterium Prado106]